MYAVNIGYGYEPAYLTVQPLSLQKTIEGGFLFGACVKCHQSFSSKKNYVLYEIFAQQLKPNFIKVGII